MTETINVPVGPDVARAFGKAQPNERQRLLTLLESIVTGWADRQITLTDVMDRIGAEAAGKGMTPEILADILKD